MPELPLIQLIPEYRDYVWGGDRLRPGIFPTAEAWIVTEDARITSSPYVGKTLAWAAVELGSDLLGTAPVSQTGRRFPLLIKLLDCAQWLSLQVHPDDAQAQLLEGAHEYGKTEAWHILAAEPGAEIIAGLKPELASTDLEAAIRDGSIARWANYLPVVTGDTIFMPAGTIHALGPGLLVYEVQQTSDWTYRVYDWGRQQSEARPLHIDKSVRVARLDASVQPLPEPILTDGGRQTLARCKYFTLEMLAAVQQPIDLATQHESFHALTVIEGAARIETADEQLELSQFESVIVPASTNEYWLHPRQACRMLKTSVAPN